LAELKTPWNFLAEMPAQARASGAGAVNSDANQIWWCYFSICANLFRAEAERMNRPATASRTRRTPKKNVPCFLDLRATNFF